MKPRATVFHFSGYRTDLKKLEIYFDYRIEFTDRKPMEFTETLKLPPVPLNLKLETLKPFLESLHLILGISYYKLYCPPLIKLSYALSREQAEFWNTVYRKGLGEFAYRNNLDPKKLAKFPFEKTSPALVRLEPPDKILLGIGGGKDSIVAAEMLRGKNVTSFIVFTGQTDPISKNVSKAIGYPILEIQRQLDPKIFKLKNTYNGHIPISAVFAFVGLLAAALYGYRSVVVGNEKSSNFGNLKYQGRVINHQWSKSEEFEIMMRDYTKKYITPDITYSSLLRPYYEIHIAEMFAKYPKYFRLFSSCNRAGVMWCGECAKCAFVFLILAPFLSRKELVGIFKKNLLLDPKLMPMYRDLLGYGDMKPFDCVGTFEEARQAWARAGKKIELVCIVGYGREGKVTEKYFKKYYPYITLGILDQSLDPDYLKKQADYDLAIKTPSIPRRLITIPYTTATNLFFSQNKNFTIGVTGSKGKSTTASLIYHILKTAGKKVRLLGNIGTPMLEYLLKPANPEEILVLELSSYMLEDIEYSPNIAVLTTLFPEHMDYHGSVEKYYKAKENIFKFQNPGDRAFKQVADPAKKVAKYLGISDDLIAKAIKTFKPLPYRLELVGTFRGITFYDDALATAPEATIFAIKKLKNIGTIFLGGADRGYDFTELEKTLHKYKIKNIVLFPDTGRRMLASRQGFNILETTSMKEAITFAYAHTPRGSICLLSTASPSYSLWKNYEEKGKEFKRLVKKLGKT